MTMETNRNYNACLDMFYDNRLDKLEVFVNQTWHSLVEINEVLLGMSGSPVSHVEMSDWWKSGCVRLKPEMPKSQKKLEMIAKSLRDQARIDCLNLELSNQSTDGWRGLS